MKYNACLLVTIAVAAVFAAGCRHSTIPPAPSARQATATPIHYLVVIFQENVSFDHYFGTYPHAANPPGEPRFVAKPGTPSVNGFTDFLLHHNPNGSNPFRLDRSQAATCDQRHAYLAEQQAYDHFLMDRFPRFTNRTRRTCPDWGHPNDLVMGYYDGNTVTALWNYAQHYAMSDNFFGTTYGPSAVGALNLIAGRTSPAAPPNLKVKNEIFTASGTVIGDPQPAGDVCDSDASVTVTGINIGDLLNLHHVTWGWFQGGFNLELRNSNGSTGCARYHQSAVTHVRFHDYVRHHAAFQFFAQTSNPEHLRPTGPIGETDRANHQYDLEDFFAAARSGHLPAVSYLKPAGYQDGHAGYSDPLDEQTFLVSTVNLLQRLPQWREMAIIITWDDSDGWYDHQPGPLINGSATPYDALTAPGLCGHGATLGQAQGRCGYGPRLPLLVISPYARANFVDHTITDQTSILRFIEDNWRLGRLGFDSYDERAGSLENMFDFSRRVDPARRILVLDPDSGEPVR
jgi:phospholipase C